MTGLVIVIMKFRDVISRINCIAMEDNTMKKYLVSWIDRGASHNGVFYAHNMKESREQTEYLAGRITNIDLLEE